MPTEVNILALVKDSHRYVYVFDDDAWGRLIDHFQKQAENPELSLNWFDAAVLEERAAKQVGMETDNDPPFHTSNI